MQRWLDGVVRFNMVDGLINYDHSLVNSDDPLFPVQSVPSDQLIGAGSLQPTLRAASPSAGLDEEHKVEPLAPIQDVPGGQLIGDDSLQPILRAATLASPASLDEHKVELLVSIRSVPDSQPIGGKSLQSTPPGEDKVVVSVPLNAQAVASVVASTSTSSAAVKAKQKKKRKTLRAAEVPGPKALKSSMPLNTQAVASAATSALIPASDSALAPASVPASDSASVPAVILAPISAAGINVMKKEEKNERLSPNASVLSTSGPVRSSAPGSGLGSGRGRARASVPGSSRGRAQGNPEGKAQQQPSLRAVVDVPNPKTLKSNVLGHAQVSIATPAAIPATISVTIPTATPVTIPTASMKVVQNEEKSRQLRLPLLNKKAGNGTNPALKKGMNGRVAQSSLRKNAVAKSATTSATTSSATSATTSTATSTATSATTSSATSSATSATTSTATSATTSATTSSATSATTSTATSTATSATTSTATSATTSTTTSATTSTTTNAATSTAVNAIAPAFILDTTTSILTSRNLEQKSLAEIYSQQEKGRSGSTNLALLVAFILSPTLIVPPLVYYFWLMAKRDETVQKIEMTESDYSRLLTYERMVVPSSDSGTAEPVVQMVSPTAKSGGKATYYMDKARANWLRDLENRRQSEQPSRFTQLLFWRTPPVAVQPKSLTVEEAKKFKESQTASVRLASQFRRS